MKTLMDGISKFEIPFDNKVHKVIHVIMELPTPVSNREMVVVNTYKNEGDKVYVGNRSCNYPVKTNKDTVMANLLVGGFILDKGEANKTIVTNISDVDIKGNIPDFVTNAMAKKRIEMLYDLEKRINKYKNGK